MLPVWFCGFIVLETAESGELFASVLFLWVFFPPFTFLFKDKNKLMFF